jgi:hypothetical protein
MPIQHNHNYNHNHSQNNINNSSVSSSIIIRSSNMLQLVGISRSLVVLPPTTCELE